MEIIIKKDVFSSLSALLVHYAVAGHIAVFIDENCFTDAVKQFIFNLKKEGFTVSEKIGRFDVAEGQNAVVAENVRLILSVGGGSVCEYARAVAAKYALDYIVCASAPSTGSYAASGFCYLKNGVMVYENYKKPLLVAADEQMLEDAPRSLSASGYGELYSTYQMIFDLKYQSFVSGKPFTAFERMRAALDRCFSQGTPTSVQLLKNLISFSGIYRARCKSAVYVLASLIHMTHASAAPNGGDLFIASYFLKNLYEGYLSLQTSGVEIPPDYSQALMYGKKVCNLNFHHYLVAENRSTYEKNDFITNEYREELLSFLKETKGGSAARVFRRFFDDSGYFLSEYVSAAMLLSLCEVCATISEGYPLVKHIYNSGLLEKIKTTQKEGCV